MMKYSMLNQCVSGYFITRIAGSDNPMLFSCLLNSVFQLFSNTIYLLYKRFDIYKNGIFYKNYIFYLDK